MIVLIAGIIFAVIPGSRINIMNMFQPLYGPEQTGLGYCPNGKNMYYNRNAGDLANDPIWVKINSDKKMGDEERLLGVTPAQSASIHCHVPNSSEVIPVAGQFGG
jgi:hypothetical protein